MVTLKKQRILLAALSAVAATVLGLGILYQKNTQETVDNPILSYLPSGGSGGACKESVGAILKPGRAATLTINDVPIKSEDMNVNLDDDGQITGELTASRSRGEYSFRPQTNCPQGSFIRPTNNVLKVCVYQNLDTTKKCIYEGTHTFDAL